MTAANRAEFEGSGGGAPSRYITNATEGLGVLARSFEDVQSSRLRHEQWAMAETGEMLHVIEKRIARELGKRLREHELWPFLEPLKGLAGPLTARAVSMIQDPWRFPGQPCTEGHILRPVFGVGSPCPDAAEVVDENESSSGGENPDRAVRAIGVESWSGPVDFSRAADEVPDGIEPPFVRCPGTMLDPRPYTGVKSLWHYAGLHVVDGSLPRRRRGSQVDWKPGLRTVALQPDGLADQIIRHRTPGYRDAYDAAKERGKPHKTARIIAVKAFLGDLLTEWKQVTRRVYFEEAA